MAKTKIVGRFATGSDVASLHNISSSRQRWLDREIGEATREAIVYFVPGQRKRAAKSDIAVGTAATKQKSAKRSPRIARLAAKKK